ncbi:RNA polymerase sigma factor [Clostridium sp. UBA4548]|uniref:RNA polymerase sigma factor n=1 Tax=Clostridium sp. UBA4548 TaxID=1946361 RepID=UPI0025BD6454|nr:RNA polymerase sigma factor [Clostridium sp. UBA4548]
MSTDSLLVEKVLKGDEKAYETLIVKYQDTIYGFLYKNNLDKEDSEDIMQEAFLKAYKNLYKLEDKSSFYHWLFKITINTMNTHLKKRKKSTVEFDESFENLKSDDKYNPENMLELKEKERELHRRLSILKEDQKNIILLKFVHGFSYKEIAEFLKINEDTVKMKAFRAKKKLYFSSGDELEEGGILNEV